MAPSGTSAKPRKPTATKAGGPRPVVPAIPLPHVKRQAAARAAAAAQASNGTSNLAATTPGLASNAEQLNGHASQAEDSERLKPAAGFEKGHKEKLHGVKKLEEAEVTTSQEAPSLENSQTDDSSSTVDSANTSTESPLSSVPAFKTDDDSSTRSRPPSQHHTKDSQKQNSTSTSDDKGRAADQTTPMPEAATTKAVAKEGRAQPPVPISPTRYQMPPPFHPANRPPPGITGNGDIAHLPRQSMPNGPPMHHSHPSNSSAIQFGMYGGSANSSPAPHSGGIAPPPGMPLGDARSNYMGPSGNTYPPMIPMGADMVPVTQFDGYSRPNMAYAPPEPFQQYGNGFGPSTPHSLHGSQSSGHPDETLPHNPYQPGHSRNGPNGFSQDFQGQGAKERMMMSQEYPEMATQHGHQHHLSVQEGNSDGLADYLRQQFGNLEMSDSMVELHYSDNRAAPVRVPGHRLIFARSPALSSISRRQPLDQRVLIMESDSKWIRSDAFYIALQRLYGFPLIPVPPPLNSMNAGEFAEAGPVEERFSFALAYATAGKLLEWEPVLRRGCEIAAHLLDWQTIEKAIEFALEGYVDNGTYESYKYDVGSKILLHGIAHFINSNLPPTFSLDSAVEESIVYSRLPVNPGPKPKTSPEVTSPVVVQGTQHASGKGHRHQLSNIQFGDLSLMEGTNASASDTPKASQQARPMSHAILSRVLMSAPFGLLQLIFDMPGPTRAHADARNRIVEETVTEREARRNRVIDAVMDGRVREPYPIIQQLRAPEPRNLDRWGVLGWQEYVLTRSGGEGSSLARRWAPIRDGQGVPVAEFP